LSDVSYAASFPLVRNVRASSSVAATGSEFCGATASGADAGGLLCVDC
jgi:hypothetical protein